MKRALVILYVVCAGMAYSQAKFPADRDQLLAGTTEKELAFIEAAGYPTGERLITLKDQLGLTRDQLRKIDAMTKDLPMSLKVKGEEIVEAEDELLKFLQTPAANERSVRSRLERVGKLRAELRFVQIQIHLKIKALLTTNQFDRYKELVSIPTK